MKIYDLSGPIEQGMWGYGKPFPEVNVQRIASLEQEGYSAHSLSLHTLAGTYVETAEHLYAGRETVEQVALQRCILKAWVAQLPEKAALEPISASELEAAVGGDIKPGEALLISTGWDRNWNKTGYVDKNPFFLPEAMEWVVEKEVGLLGVDIPHLQDPRNDDGQLLKLFYTKDRLLLAPLMNLRAAGKGPFTLIALPLQIPRVCSTPCRAILIDTELY